MSALDLQVTSNKEVVTHYRGWRVNTHMVKGKLWLQWQHPSDPSIRYGCPLMPQGLEATINHVRFLIDTSILLESKVSSDKTASPA